jgi:hypothetical protein
MKKLTLSKAKARAWKQFSLWVRLSNAEDELVMCYTCEKILPYKKTNAGHGIGGRNNAILFEERIVKPQCFGCNIWGRGQYQIFTRKLIDELGLEEYDQIVFRSRLPIKYTIQDYLDIEAEYKEKIKVL